MACAAAVLASVGSLFVGDGSLRELVASRAHQVLLEQEAFEKQADNAKQRGHILRLESDPHTIERIARERLRMIHPGEVSYIEAPELGAASAFQSP